MRTFLAIPIDEQLRNLLSDLSISLRQQVSTRASWVPARNFHFTVRFLGDIDPMLTIDLEDICQKVTKTTPAFDIVLDRLGAFPSLDRPRVIWAGGETPNTFRELTRSLNNELTKLDFKQDRRRPTAHVTIARLKGNATQQEKEKLQANRNIKNWKTRADKLVLMESKLTSNGAIYNPLFALPLGKG